ncbi:MAG: substrate-binding domain-containing protein [Atopobiaceae bacterium]|nr:substrate-binding domain-containing protein [Atopobiaceae bacterium]
MANDSPSVRPETRERVIRAMRELGYHPSFAGRSLRLNRYQAVGLAMSNIVSMGNVRRLSGILDAAASHGYAITLVQPQEGPTSGIADIERRMASLPVDAMIYNLNRTYHVDDFLAFEPESSLRCVAIASIEHPLLACIDADQADCARTIAEHLIARGHRHMRMVSGPRSSIAAVQRNETWLDTLAGRGLPAIEPIEGDWSADSGYEAGIKIAQDPGVTAVFAANDNMAMGVIAALRDRGLHVPEDVSVVGTDDSLTESVARLGLTSYAFDDHAVGELAFEAAVSPEGAATFSLVPGRLVERASVRDIR